VRLEWKFAWLAILVALTFSVTGCGGLNASKSVSPASFFLPGLMKASPPATDCTNLLASVR
jgi:hypothetical protein